MRPQQLPRRLRLGSASGSGRVTDRLALQRARAAGRAAGPVYEALSCEVLSDLGGGGRALAARHRALDLFQLLDERAAVGATPGAGCRACRGCWAAATTPAVTPCVQSPPWNRSAAGMKLAPLAYSNMAQLSMLAGAIAETVDWGEARRWRERPAGSATARVEIHALNSIGVPSRRAMTAPRDVTTSAKSLDLALAADAHEHVGRAYTISATTASSIGSSVDA